MPTVRTLPPAGGIEPKQAPVVQRKGYPIPQLQPPPGPVAPDASALGAGFGRTVGSIGEAFYAAELERQDQVRLTDADSQLWALRNKLMSPQTGALSVKGKDALALPDQVGQSFDDQVAKIREGLNSRQQPTFDRSVAQHKAAMTGQLNEHIAQQMEAVDVDSTKGLIENAKQASFAQPYKPEIAAESEATVRKTVGDFYRHHGRSDQDEDVKAAIAAEVSSLHEGLIKTMLDDTRNPHADLNAKVWYETHEDSILPSKRGDILKALSKGSALGEGQRLADSIWSARSPDATENSLKDEIAKRADGEVRKAAEEQIHSRIVSSREDTRFNEEQASKQAKAVLDSVETNIKNNVDRFAKSKTFEQIVPQSVRDQLPLPVERSLREYWKQLQEKGHIETDWGTYYSLMKEAAADPNKFAKEPLMKYAHQLGESELKQVMETQTAIIKGNRAEADKQLDGIRTNERIINGTLRRAGIDPDAKDKETKDRVDTFWKMVDDQVMTLQRSTGKKVSDDDIQGIADKLLEKIVIEKGSWWNILPGGKPFYDVEQYRFEAPPPVPAPWASHASLPNGGGKLIDKATAEKFYEAAGRDRAKAEALAIQNGWKVQ